MAVDLVLAILHHLLAFALVAILAVEAVVLKPGLDRAGVDRLARIDGAYGAVAGAIILIGVGRVVFGLKGWEYYLYNHAFWAKMGAFAVVGALSIPPTLRFARWRKAAAADAAYVPPGTEIAGARRYLRGEMAVFVLIPVFAAMMARGVGY